MIASVRALLPGRADVDLRPRVARADLLAGLTVGVVALPLALAFGVSAGVGPAAGLVTAVVAGVVAAVFGGSHVQISGPTGAMAVVLAPLVAQHGAGAVPVVAVLAGVLVVLAGVARLGRVVTFVPWPVVEGFTLGIAAIIALQQVPAALGVTEPVGGNPLVTAVRAVGDSLGNGVTTLWTLAIVAAVAVVMLALPRVAPAVPASLVAVVLATVVAQVADAPVARIGALPASLPAPALPVLDAGTLRALIGPAVAVAALAAIESLLSARVAAAMPVPPLPGGGGDDDELRRYDPDRELVGQGLASLASGVFGGMPATGAIARTAVNVRAGARTRASAVVHALVILAVIAFATGPVSAVPLAALAGVLVVTATRMVSLATVRAVLGSTRADAVVLVVTAVVTLAVDLVEAVQIGLLVAAFFALRSVAKATAVHREPLPGPAHEGDEHIALYRLDGAMFFGAADRIRSEIRADADAYVVVLRLSHLRLVDATGAHALGELVADLERSGVTVLVKGVQDRHRQLLTRVGVLDELRHESHLFDDLDRALAHARSHVGRRVAA
ncbi:SulP family inorganic anion transporter [Cellulomonas fimi]|uniref:Sulphate transporter n=1 Tax=Cellulomonas fimi (strain ATCC 484 / DSM 20113 / JCM 1341 / CCUG 24087 / LMG 16345 / NBRC 15513 / NCIMB 8980 / NCTC 7547 / NRS-133) TaxID=590998 RepID=F4H635_CELFA|nr:SulP family inorganic anion transporter [Cellulomonas fimi]AEE46765.1 sulphate transporter [Cellulomonas fimi ATCC 484]NNH08838.1 SulP family inorganic anion transporter [Cellulomonas fimi]VEH34119.1 Putative sulfate transporter ychM [Cellulomonas fimi]